MAKNDADMQAIRRMAEMTAKAIDLDRWQVIANVLEGDLKRAYEMGRNYPNKAALERLGIKRNV